MSGQVFLSYSQQDAAYVERLAASLAAAGLPVRLDHTVASPEQWAAVVEPQVRSARVVVAIMSPAANSSESVQREIAIARQLGLPILPIRLAGEPSQQLAAYPYEDARNGSIPGDRFLANARHLATAPAPTGGPMAAPPGGPTGPVVAPKSFFARPAGIITIIAAAVVALTVVAVAVVAIVWINRAEAPEAAAPDPGAASTSPSQAPGAGSGSAQCEWITNPEAGATVPPEFKDVGKPPATVPRNGARVLVFNTNLGVIKVQMDLAKSPCTAASFAHLISKRFFDNTSCHRLVPAIYALQCGDHTGTGAGGPRYRYADENLPTGQLLAYVEGDVALANTGSPASNGGQFFFVYGPCQINATYTLFG